MAVKIEDYCCGCALPCLGIGCRNTNVPVAVCDWCESEEDEFYESYGEVLCYDCFRDSKMSEAKKIPLNSVYKERLVSCCEWCGEEANELFISEDDDAAICEECFEEMLKDSKTVSAERVIENYA